MQSLPLKGIRILLSILSWVVFTLSIYAQEDSLYTTKKITVIGSSLDYGYLLKHTPTLEEIGDAYPRGISISWSKFLLTERAWEFCNCFPRVGVDLGYWNWDKPDVLGYGVLSMGFIEPYFRTHKKTNIFFRMGMGGAYLSEPYDEADNPLNEAYSTDLSFALMVGLGLNFRLDDSWNLQFLAKYNHTSNGGVNTPNKGLNFPTLSMGVSKSLEPIVFPNLKKIGKREPPEDKTRWTLTHFSGWSNATVGDKDKFYVFGFMGKYSHWIANRSALTAGTEVIFDYSRKEQIELESLDNDFVQAAATIGHEFWLGRVTFSQDLGVYYYNDYRINDDIYQRYTLTYNFNSHIFGGFSLKAHGHVADFFDFRIGYRF